MQQMNVHVWGFLGCWIAANPVELVVKMKILLNDCSLYENEGGDWRVEQGLRPFYFGPCGVRFVSRISTR